MNVPLAKQRADRENAFYRRVAIGLKLAAMTYFGILAFMMISETRLVFPGAGLDRGDWKHPGIDAEEVEFSGQDGTKIFGYFLPQVEANGTLLFCHGNEENIAMCAREAELLRSTLNVQVLVFDYRGFGKTQGKPTESGVLSDAEAAVAWLAERTQMEPDQLILFGRSLGGGVAVHLASRHGARALILDRTFSSAVDVAASSYWWLPVRFVMRNQFLSIAKIGYYEGPLLQFHGDVDEIIPLWSAERLFHKSPSIDKEFQIAKGLTHKVPMPADFYPRMQAWLEGLPESTPDGP